MRNFVFDLYKLFDLNYKIVTEMLWFIKFYSFEWLIQRLSLIYAHTYFTKIYQCKLIVCIFPTIERTKFVLYNFNSWKLTTHQNIF